MKVRALLAEFIGTFALAFVVFLTVENFRGNPVQLLAIALGVGLTIMVMGTAFGPISGGHINPSVTFGMMIAKRISIADGIAYWVAQIIGGIAAVFTAAFLLGPNGEASRAAISVSRGAGIGIVPSVIAEAIAVFFVLTVIFMTAVDRRAPANGALYLGLTFTIGVLAIGPISGGALNPAVGAALSVGSGKWDNALSWSIGPLLGAGLAALLYNGMWSKEEVTS